MRESCIKVIATIILITALGGCGVKPMDSRDSDPIGTYDTADSVNKMSDVKITQSESKKTSSTTSEKPVSEKKTQPKIVCSYGDIEIIEYDIDLYESPNEGDCMTYGCVSVIDGTSSMDTLTEDDTDNDIDKISESQQNIPEYSAFDLQSLGVIYWGGWRWTWYSQNILPGGGLSIPGRHVDENGYVCDEDDYICLAATSLSKGCIVDTPFGKQGKVYDSGCAYGTLDVYTSF